MLLLLLPRAERIGGRNGGIAAAFVNNREPSRAVLHLLQRDAQAGFNNKTS